MIRFKTELDEIESAFVAYDLHQKESLNALDTVRLSSLYFELTGLVREMLSYMKQKPMNFNVDEEVIKKAEESVKKLEMKEIEKDILKKTRGVFKYRTSCYFKDHTSSKNELVQVGYLDLDDNIVFNEPDEEHIGDPSKLVRYLPGFMVRGYRSCEEYKPIINSHNGKDTKEINEVISSEIIQYNSSTYGSSPRVTYSVIGFLGDNEELIYYNEIVDNK